MLVNTRYSFLLQSGNADAHQDQLIIYLSKSVEARTEDLCSDWRISSRSWQCFADFQDREKNFCLAPNGCQSLKVFSVAYGDGREALVLGHGEQYSDGTEDCYVSYSAINRYKTINTWFENTQSH